MRGFDGTKSRAQQVGFLFALIFILVWVLSENFWVAFFLAILALLRFPGLWAMLIGRKTSTPSYHVGRFDPNANEPNEDAALQSMPRYSEGRIVPLADPPPTRTYAIDEDDETPVPAPPVRATPRFGSAKVPPRKPVDLPRRRR